MQTVSAFMDSIWIDIMTKKWTMITLKAIGKKTSAYDIYRSDGNMQSIS